VFPIFLGNRKTKTKLCTINRTHMVQLRGDRNICSIEDKD
jgi:hypothetical protein